MNVEGVWEQNVTGRGAVVSILDDGIEYSHPDLQDNYVSDFSAGIQQLMIQALFCFVLFFFAFLLFLLGM